MDRRGRAVRPPRRKGTVTFMSKHPSNDTKRNLLRRGLAGVLTLALLLSLLPSTLVTARAASWADPYVETLVEWGVMRGDVGGNMAPDRSITRAEFVTMMNRAYGYTKLGSMPFTDVRVRDWYYEDINIGYNIGYFQGTSPTTAEPNSSLTREQAAVLLARNMALQETVGETLGFSDTRTLSDWSRGLVGAAAENGIISGYEDGSFRPAANITRGEVAAMLVRAIGTPIQEAGDHSLGNVYGNVTVNTSGVKLRDGVIAGNLYLTGGIDLGDILLENITVLGEIIVSGGGESNSSQSSIIMRNVVADNMVVDSIGDQFITIRAEGNTDIPTTTVRTSAYVDDSSLPGYGLSLITLDGENGALYQLAGNVKEVLNKTPGSSMQFVQGTADKATVDEAATGSSVLVDGDAVVGELDLDVATNVTGTGDIKNLNVGAAGSTVEQLPDKIDIRPGITTDINGSTMNSTQGAESSSDPKLLAGYPAVKNIAPTSATLVFQTNKSGTIYWAVSAVADGSVSEADLLEPPSYGNKIVASGNLRAASANTDYTAAVARLTSGGSYYVTAMLVDGRNQRSPIKVTAFTTPDNTVPAFAAGYPVMSLVSTEIAQATVMTTKSCLLYYALLPAGAAAPTPNEFKAAAIPGNLGYGSQSVTKNVTVPINVNNVQLEEKTNYVLYLWLTDHDGAQSARSVTALRFTTPDETPPVVTDAKQLFSNTTPTANSLQVEYTIDEPADFVWAIVPESLHMRKDFLAWTKATPEPGDSDRLTLEFGSEAELQAAKVQLASGAGALLSGASNRSPMSVQDAKLLFENAKTSSFVLYYMADDNATATGNLSAQIKALRVRTKDETPPDVTLRFYNGGSVDVDKDPQADADVRILFTEQVKGTNTKDRDIFLSLYDDVLEAEESLENAQSEEAKKTAQAQIARARNAMADKLSSYIEFHTGRFTTSGNRTTLLEPLAENATPPATGSWINWRNARISMPGDGSGNLEILLPGVRADEDGNIDRSKAGIQLEGGGQYYFEFKNIYDLAYPTGNALVRDPDHNPYYREFQTSFAQVMLEETEVLKMAQADVDSGLVGTLFPTAPTDAQKKNDPARIDLSFTAKPTTVEQVGDAYYWDMLLWSDTSFTFTLYARQLTEKDGTAIPATDSRSKWQKMGQDEIIAPTSGMAYTSLYRVLKYGTRPTEMPGYDKLNQLGDWEYGIHVDRMLGTNDASAWPHTLNMRVSVVAGTPIRLNTYVSSGRQAEYDRALQEGVTSIGVEDPFTMKKPFEVRGVPGIETGYPSMTALNDITAEITVRLDKDGYVHYLVLPMTRMYKTENNVRTEIERSRVTISEDVAKTIEDYEMYYKPNEKDTSILVVPSDSFGPIPSGGITGSTVDSVTVGGVSANGNSNRPDRNDVVNCDLDEYNHGKMPATGPAAKRDTPIKIPLTGLSANTIYYVFLVTESGSGTSSQFSDVYCYRFTTKEASPPVVQVYGGGTGIDVHVKDDHTTVTYYLARNGYEGAGFGDAFKDSIDSQHTWYAADSTAWTNSNTSNGRYQYRFNNKTYYFTFSMRGKDLDRMTVIDAMTVPVYSNPNYRDEYYEGSLFDLFADGNVKLNFAGIISGESFGGGGDRITAGTPGHMDARINSKAFDRANSISFDPKALGNTPYTFLSLGTNESTSGTAFRAYYSVQKDTSQHPTVYNSTLLSGGTDNGTTYTGQVKVDFTQDLYGGTNRGYAEMYPLDYCGMLTPGHMQMFDTNEEDGQTYASLGYFANANSAATIASGISVAGLVSKHYDASSSPKVEPKLVGRSITFNLTNVEYDRPYEFTFMEGLCNEGGDGINEMLRISIAISRTPKDPNDLTKGYTYDRTLRVLPTTQETQQAGKSNWDGLSATN